MSDTNTPVPNVDEQAAAVLRVFDEAMAEGTGSAGALAHVMQELADYAQGFPVLTYNPVRVKSYEYGYEYAVKAARLGAIAAGLRGLAREQSPPPAPTNEQAIHRAPTPIPIPPEGIPDNAKSDGCCWLGYWMNGFGCWAWIFCSYEWAVSAISVGCTHYLPHNTPALPANTPPTP